MLAKKKKNSQKESASAQAPDRSDWRNTERGKQEKNSKGIYYSNGNYEAFARPEKPEGVEEKSAYILLFGAGWSDASFPDSHSGGHGCGRRRLRRHL